MTTFLSLLINFGCDESNNKYNTDERQRPIGTVPSLQDYVNGGLPPEKLEEFKIPDSINTSLIICAFDEHVPLNGRTFIVYDDTTRISATKISYLIDSTIKTEALIKIRDDEFKSKFTAENYRIASNKVYWGYINGSLSTSYEYLRLY
ncbi:MAG: hypothetical protein IPM51_05815 [Sphingobacteriaceae bacterium]|nr:hypothetical protein [Sphingobacteriaceae bacterium]